MTRRQIYQIVITDHDQLMPLIHDLVELEQLSRSKQTRPIRSCLMSRQLTRALAGVSLRDETLRLDHLTMA